MRSRRRVQDRLCRGAGGLPGLGMPARRRDADITRIPAQRHLLQHMIASSANRFHLFAFYRQAQRARGHVAAGDLGANACFAGSYAFYFVDCCSLGEGCGGGGRSVRRPSGRSAVRRILFAIRTNVHNLNSMPPRASADSQRPLCNCCYRPGPCGCRSSVLPSPDGSPPSRVCRPGPVRPAPRLTLLAGPDGPDAGV
jgi:hypothetical protein